MDADPVNIPVVIRRAGARGAYGGSGGLVLLLVVRGGGRYFGYRLRENRLEQRQDKKQLQETLHKSSKNALMV